MFGVQNIDILKYQQNVYALTRQIAYKIKAMDINLTNSGYFIDKILTF